jgi:hypothetical protein
MAKLCQFLFIDTQNMEYQASLEYGNSFVSAISIISLRHHISPILLLPCSFLAAILYEIQDSSKEGAGNITAEKDKTIDFN